ncbi:MAG: EAL domain-containing protein [Candidatus Aquilonibacter sp.]|jgi:diguanylate cyclase (GGDEF)-like protein/PAS domain S-box-containing protein
MVRETSRQPGLNDALGIVVSVLAAILLAFVLYQVVRLGSQAGLDRDALTRERIAVTETQHILATIDALDDYRYALLVQSNTIAAARETAQSRIDALQRDFTSGAAGMFRLYPEWKQVQRYWTQSRELTGGPDALPRMGPLMNAIGDLLTGLQDRSGLSYDPSPTAENLADVLMQETVFGISGTRRLESIGALALKERGLSLSQRLDAAGNLMSLRGAFDLTRDQLPAAVTNLDQLAPEQQAQWAVLPALSQRMNAAGNAFLDGVVHSVMLQPNPTISSAMLHRSAQATVDATMAVFTLSGRALDTSLAARGRIQAQRNRYLYLAFVLGAILVVGIMISIAQFIARRDRGLLREALREAARLQAELARQEAEEALRLTEAQFRTVFDGAAIGIAVVDRTGTMLDGNDVFRTMFGDSIASAIEGHETELESLWSGQRETFEYEAQARSLTGQEIWTDATISIVNDENRHPRFAICMFRDKTELKHSERRIQHSKTHDGLTGLPNRALFDEHLRRRFAESGALLDSFFAVLFVDLEHFKEINESLGHAAGDLVLTQIAGRLRSSIDPRDIVARLGGDEFAVLLQSLGDIIHVESLARRILNNLSKSIPIGSRSVFLSGSIGIAIGSSSYERGEDVMRDAEIAMQHAKASGGARFALFDSTMHERAQKRLQLISDLRLAVERNEFRMLYQPIVSLADGSASACEALIRWDHPTQGVIGPNEFIPLAEQTGLAHTIGRFVLETASEQFAIWKRNRAGKLNFCMHVNVSASELSDPDFERTLVQIVEHHGLHPSDFTLEITESVVLDAGTRANQTIGRVRERGFNICIDDFGTGYSSLRYLQQFEVDSIKIDRSFVCGADGLLASEPIVRTLISLAEAYNVRIVAEGVETAEQSEMLRNAGCRLGQGFLYAHPLAAAELTERYAGVLGRVARSASA